MLAKAPTDTEGCQTNFFTEECLSQTSVNRKG